MTKISVAELMMIRSGWIEALEHLSHDVDTCECCEHMTIEDVLARLSEIQGAIRLAEEAIANADSHGRGMASKRAN